MKASTYIWQQSNWPHMTWQTSRLSNLLAEVNMLRGKLQGRLSMFGLEEQHSSMLNAVTQEILHSSQIEGEMLNRDSVRSSVARHLGLAYEGLPTSDHSVEGVVEVMIDAVCQHSEPLDADRLFSWHKALFPYGQSGLYRIKVGGWREGDEPMQVVSGAMGHQKIHYEAPPSDQVPHMMQQFLDWINSRPIYDDPLITTAVAHLWFVTIHPFDDGNGRLCRTVTEWMLSQADGTSQRYYSLSSEIINNRNAYYLHLEQAQKGNLDVTDWVEWFLQTLQKAIEHALLRTENVVKKTQFWNRHRNIVLNDRQRKVINMLFDGFDGKLTSSKWYKINHCSQDTASRDINDLISKGVLRKAESGGRSTSYELCI